METLSRQITSHAELYENDYFLWLQRLSDLLKQRDFAVIDIDNLIEEVEDMGSSQKQSIESNLEIILMHLLKYKYQPEKRSNSWIYTILEHRRRLHKAFKNSPSLKQHFLQEFDDCYQGARELASAETGMVIEIFPDHSPFSTEQVLDKDYFPNN